MVRYLFSMADTTVTVKDHICALFEAERRTTALLLEERNRRYAELRAADSEALHAAFAA